MVQVGEEFPGFVQAESTRGQALVDKFVWTGCLPHDGAANMAGAHRGVQAIIRQRIPDTTFVHCKAHCLNLAIWHASKTLARNILGAFQQIVFAFDYFGQRLLAFQDCLSQDAAVGEEMPRCTKLWTLCEM